MKIWIWFSNRRIGLTAKRSLALQALLGVLSTAATPAQIRLSFSEALSQSIRNNPQIAAADAHIQSAKGLSLQAGLKPNPRAIVQLENYRAWESPPFSFANNPDNYGFLAQLIERGGKRQRRMAFADATVQRFVIERDLLGRQIASRVAAAYWSAAAAQKVRLIWQRQAQYYADLVTYTENRFKEGIVAEVDVLRTKVERNKTLLAGANASEAAVQARVALFREMGRTDFPTAVELDDPSRPATQIPVPGMQLILATRFELQLARQGVIEAQAKLDLQRANAKVDPDVSLGYKRTVGVDTVYAAISVPLPLRNRNQGNIASALADVSAAQANLETGENMVRAEVTAAQEEYKMRQGLLTELLPNIRQEADETARIARAAYREGGMDLIRLLDAERNRLDAELLYYQTLLQFQQSVVSVQNAIGMSPGIDGPNPPAASSPNGVKP